MIASVSVHAGPRAPSWLGPPTRALAAHAAQLRACAASPPRFSASRPPRGGPRLPLADGLPPRIAEPRLPSS